MMILLGIGIGIFIGAAFIILLTPGIEDEEKRAY